MSGKIANGARGGEDDIGSCERYFRFRDTTVRRRRPAARGLDAQRETDSRSEDDSTRGIFDADVDEHGRHVCGIE
jgi:hypothetical protein